MHIVFQARVICFIVASWALCIWYGLFYLVDICEYLTPLIPAMWSEYCFILCFVCLFAPMQYGRVANVSLKKKINKWRIQVWMMYGSCFQHAFNALPPYRLFVTSANGSIFLSVYCVPDYPGLLLLGLFSYTSYRVSL